MNNFWDNVKKIGLILVNLIIIAVIVLIVINIAKSIAKNYEINKEIIALKGDIEKLQEKKKGLENIILYYKTQTFQELELRRSLGLKKADEVMIILPENDGAGSKEGTVQFFNTTEVKQDNVIQPNYILWWNYIFRE